MTDKPIVLRIDEAQVLTAEGMRDVIILNGTHQLVLRDASAESMKAIYENFVNAHPKNPLKITIYIEILPPTGEIVK